MRIEIEIEDLEVEVARLPDDKRNLFEVDQRDGYFYVNGEASFQHTEDYHYYETAARDESHTELEWFHIDGMSEEQTTIIRDCFQDEIYEFLKPENFYD